MRLLFCCLLSAAWGDPAVLPDPAPAPAEDEVAAPIPAEVGPVVPVPVPAPAPAPVSVPTEPVAEVPAAEAPAPDPLPEVPPAVATEAPPPAPAAPTAPAPNLGSGAVDWLLPWLAGPGLPTVSAPVAPVAAPSALDRGIDLAMDRLDDRGLPLALHRGAWALLFGLIALLARTLAQRLASGPARRALQLLITASAGLLGATAIWALVALLPLAWLPWLAAVGIAAAAALGWSLRPILADLVAGVGLRLSATARPGVRLHGGGLNGELLKLGARSSAVRSEDGRSLRVPNGRLMRASFVLEQGAARALRAELQLPPDLAGADALRCIREAALVSPWVDDRQPLAIEATGEGRWQVALSLLPGAPRDLVRIQLSANALAAARSRPS